jgi:hypothetical protein
MAKKQPKQWVWSPSSRASCSSPEATTRVQVEQKARELIDKVLKPKHIQPPPEDPGFNYVIDLGTKWHGRYFYFVAAYACTGPNAISPTFETNFARLEHVGGGRFNLSYMRHTGKWHELFDGLTLDECLNSIRDDPWFHP